MTDRELFAKLKILIVDDSAEMRSVLAALCESMGVGAILSASSGEQGLKLFCAEAPDLIITDGSMRPMDGYELTRSVRSGECREDGTESCDRDVPVLMISGHVGPEMVRLARDNGVTDYIGKPITAAVLYERILAAVSKPIHIVETKAYRGPSPTRRLVPRISDTFSE
ncbi:response regulator [Parvibaculum sedimenti]|uniref:Response regulator n=1 Tax=Parvibaculum sedimenti TaxID=2608632 RepID=A0A6N6VLK0_9HYPH|nr:response regulator [Parvibaculum sedimenti]KAB7739497.1 response regulator [Parvibaculum sedimenti]